MALKQLKHQLHHQSSHFSTTTYRLKVWLSLYSSIIILLLPFNSFYCCLCSILLGCDSSIPSNVWAFLSQEISVSGCVQFNLLDWVLIAAGFNTLNWLMLKKRENEGHAVFSQLITNTHRMPIWTVYNLRNEKDVLNKKCFQVEIFWCQRTKILASRIMKTCSKMLLKSLENRCHNGSAGVKRTIMVSFMSNWVEGPRDPREH